jgi:ribonuclease R
VQCSRTERVAEALERDVAELKKVQYMADKQDEIFDAVISGLFPWGVFVVLDNTVEGLIPEAALLRKGYRFIKALAIYEGKRRRNHGKRRILQQGLAVRVRLVQASEEERRIIFALHSLMPT